jgi:hypothetical protein
MKFSHPSMGPPLEFLSSPLYHKRVNSYPTRGSAIPVVILVIVAVSIAVVAILFSGKSPLVSELLPTSTPQTSSPAFPAESPANVAQPTALPSSGDSQIDAQLQGIDTKIGALNSDISTIDQGLGQSAPVIE